MHKPIKYAEKLLTYGANGAWTVFDAAQPDQAESLVHAEMVRQAAAEVLAEDEAAAGLAARDRFALPQVRAGIPQADPRRQGRLQNPAQRESRRDQGADHRARRQDPDGEGLPRSTATSKTSWRSTPPSSSTWKTFSPAATSAPTTTKSCTITAPAPSRTAAARCSPST